MKMNVLILLSILCVVISAVLFFTIFVFKPVDVGSAVQEAAQKTGRSVLRTIY